MENENGVPKICIQPDKLKAYLEIIPPMEYGEPCTREDVRKALVGNNIMEGFSQESIDEAIKPENWGKQFLLAQGVPVIDGEDGVLKFLVAFKSNNSPLKDEKGNVDYHNLGQINNVRKGQPLVERIPPVLGKKGLDVTGKDILPRIGRDRPLPRGKNTVCNEDNTTLYAGIDGHVTIVGGRVTVQPVFEVNGDVNLSSGNIDFIGNVIIHGNVTNGFVVKAEGDIEIRGFIEGAEVTAGGNISVRGGIKTGSKGIVKANDCIMARFIENSRLEAGRDVIVNEAIMQSFIRAGGSVIVKERKATIVGGLVQASDLVEANNIGSQLATQTVIEVGVNPYYREEYNKLTRLKTEKSKMLDNINSNLQLFQRPGVNPQDLPDKKRIALIKMLDEFKILRKEISGYDERLAFLEQEFQRIKTAKVRAREMAYPGVRITIGSAIYVINDGIKYSEFVLADGEIHLSSLS